MSPGRAALAQVPDVSPERLSAHLCQVQELGQALRAVAALGKWAGRAYGRKQLFAHQGEG